MRVTIPILGLALIAAQAQAQTTAPSTTSPTPTTPPAATMAPAMPASPTTTAPAHRTHSRKTLQERFDSANTTHDGHLTLEQAKAGMPGLARHFDAVDKDKKGYVTLNDIHAYNSEHHARRSAAHHPKADAS